MRRRTFRPVLESLGLRITPSDVAGLAVITPAAVGGGATTYLMHTPSPVMNPEPTDTDPSDGGSSPDWDDTSGPYGPDNIYLWCPMIGE